MPWLCIPKRADETIGATGGGRGGRPPPLFDKILISTNACLEKQSVKFKLGSTENLNGYLISMNGHLKSRNRYFNR